MSDSRQLPYQVYNAETLTRCIEYVAADERDELMKYAAVDVFIEHNSSRGSIKRLAEWFAESYLKASSLQNHFDLLKALRDPVKIPYATTWFELPSDLVEFLKAILETGYLKQGSDQHRIELIRELAKLIPSEIYQVIEEAEIRNKIPKALASKLEDEISLSEEDKRAIKYKVKEDCIIENCKYLNYAELISLLERFGKDDLLAVIELSENIDRKNHQLLLVRQLIASTESNEQLKIYLSILDTFQDITAFHANGSPELNQQLSKLSDSDKNILMEFIGNIYAEDIEEIKKYFKDHPNLPVLEQMIADKNPAAFFVIRTMLHYVKGFGSLEHADGLLTCAQVASRKNNEGKIFNPTVITQNDLTDYLKLLKERGIKGDVRERFMVSGTHWTAYDLQIKNGVASIVVIDSLGRNDNGRYGFETPKNIELIKEVFPEVTLYVPTIKRQNTGAGCSVFALDDVMHLHTLESRLSPKAQYQNLHDYFEGQQKRKEMLPLRQPHDKEQESVEVVHAELPLTLLRTMQSDKLRTQIIPKRTEEKDKKIYKTKQGQNQTALENVTLSFKKDEESQKEFNRRLDHKLDRMAYHNLTYLTSHTIAEITHDMSQHSLAGFKARSLSSSSVIYKAMGVDSAELESEKEVKKEVPVSMTTPAPVSSSEQNTKPASDEDSPSKLSKS